MRHRNIIDEINRENERRFWLPLIMAFLLPLVIIACIILVYSYSKEIDKFASGHPVLFAVILVALGFFGLWRLFKGFSW